MDNKVVCTFCGEEYSAELSRCPECGEKNKNVSKKDEAFDEDILDTSAIIDDDAFDDLDDDDDDMDDETPVRRRREENKEKIPTWLKVLILIVAGLAIIIAAVFMLYKVGMVSFGKDLTAVPSASVSLPVASTDPIEGAQPGESSEATPQVTPGSSLSIGDPDAQPSEPVTSEPATTSEPEPEESKTPAEPDPVESKPVVECSSIEVNRTDISFFTRGEVYVFNATVAPSASYEYVEWSSSDPTVVKVDSSGTATAVNGGTATVTATCGDKSASCIVRCQFEAAEFMTMSNEDITMKTAGETAKLSVQDIDVADETELEWTSSDDLVASVDKNGLVTAVGKGTATIKATLDGKVAECVVRVNIASIAGSDGADVTLEMNHTDVTLVTVGEYVQLSVSASDGRTIDSSSLTWVSKDEAVCTVDSTGLVTAVANGTTTVYTTVSGEAVSCIIRVNLK